MLSKLKKIKKMYLLILIALVGLSLFFLNLNMIQKAKAEWITANRDNANTFSDNTSLPFPLLNIWGIAPADVGMDSFSAMNLLVNDAGDYLVVMGQDNMMNLHRLLISAENGQLIHDTDLRRKGNALDAILSSGEGDLYAGGHFTGDENATVYIRFPGGFPPEINLLAGTGLETELSDVSARFGSKKDGDVIIMPGLAGVLYPVVLLRCSTFQCDAIYKNFSFPDSFKNDSGDKTNLLVTDGSGDGFGVIVNTPIGNEIRHYTYIGPAFGVTLANTWDITDKIDSCWLPEFLLLRGGEEALNSYVVVANNICGQNSFRIIAKEDNIMTVPGTALWAGLQNNTDLYVYNSGTQKIDVFNVGATPLLKTNEYTLNPILGCSKNFLLTNDFLVRSGCKCAGPTCKDYIGFIDLITQNETFWEFPNASIGWLRGLAAGNGRVYWGTSQGAIPVIRAFGLSLSNTPPSSQLLATSGEQQAIAGETLTIIQGDSVTFNGVIWDCDGLGDIVGKSYNYGIDTEWPQGSDSLGCPDDPTDYLIQSETIVFDSLDQSGDYFISVTDASGATSTSTIQVTVQAPACVCTWNPKGCGPIGGCKLDEYYFEILNDCGGTCISYCDASFGDDPGDLCYIGPPLPPLIPKSWREILPKFF